MNKRGFTLLEVMIALAIVGGLLVTVLYTLNYHLSIVERHETGTVALMLAKEKLMDSRKSTLGSSGQFEEPYSAYGYSVAVKGSPYPGITEVSVTVKKDKEQVTVRELIRAVN